MSINLDNVNLNKQVNVICTFYFRFLLPFQIFRSKLNPDQYSCLVFLCYCECSELRKERRDKLRVWSVEVEMQEKWREKIWWIVGILNRVLLGLSHGPQFIQLVVSIYGDVFQGSYINLAQCFPIYLFHIYEPFYDYNVLYL